MHNFKKIVIHTLLLLLFTILLLIVFVIPYFKGQSYYYQDYKVRKSLSGKIDTLIIGSSHALRSINPTVLNEQLGVSSYNLASPVMSMYGRYTLLKKEVERNPIKTVIIDVSYNAMTLDRKSLGFEGDIYVLGRFDNIYDRINFFFKAFSFDEYAKVLSDTVKRSKYTIENPATKEPSQYTSYGFIPVETNDQSLSLDIKKSILNTESFDTVMKKENLDYFNDMIELCKNNNIRVILVVIPVTEHMILRYDNNDEVFSQYVTLAKKYGIEYYDFNLDKKRTKLYSDKESFYDYSHLSELGANVFSNRLAKILKQINEGKDVSNEFYTSYEQIKEAILKV